MPIADKLLCVRGAHPESAFTVASPRLRGLDHLIGVRRVFVDDTMCSEDAAVGQACMKLMDRQAACMQPSNLLRWESLRGCPRAKSTPPAEASGVNYAKPEDPGLQALMNDLVDWRPADVTAPYDGR